VSDEVERIAAIEDQFSLLREATERLSIAQQDVTELARLRRRVIQEMHDQGLSYADIAEAAGLSRGRIHQIRHQGPAPEGAFLGSGLVRIVTPLKRDEIKGRPVVAVEDVAVAKRLEDLARSYELDVEQEHVPLGGEIDLNRSGLIIVCGPRLSEKMRALYEEDPVISWEKTSSGAWALRDSSTGKLYVSGSDREPSEYYDVAYLGRLRRPDGDGRIIAFTGVHPEGSLGVSHLITTEISALWSEARDRSFSMIVGVKYDPDTHEPLTVERLTPIHLHG
jgi:Sigma-70, region 4